ncbi:MAG: sensor histidine kinase [Egibacteraceae bacterium]
MRRRLLSAMLAAAAAAVVLLGLPLALGVRSQFRAEALDATQRDVEQVRALIQSADSMAVAFRLMELLADASDVELMLLELDGTTVRGTVEERAGSSPLYPDVALARTGRVGRFTDGEVVAVSVPLRLRNEPLVLRLVRPGEVLNRRLRLAWLSIAVLAATALGAAALLARRLGRRLALPVEALADSARRLGQGDFSARAPRSGVPEPDEVAAALDATAERLAAALERSRSLGADASHQLRTPLTALRLDLEALELGANGPSSPLVQAAVTEVDRLEATIDELEQLATLPTGEEQVDLAALASERLASWRALARVEGRSVQLEQERVPPVRARPAALGQALQVLLDNALEHGGGTVTVSVRVAQRPQAPPGPTDPPPRRAVWVRLCVADEGPGPTQNDLDGARIDATQRGGTRGLALARSLVEAEGGRLRLDTVGETAVPCVLMPAA